MKESLSITYIFQIVILFILLFTGIMALTINNSNAFAVKDEIVNAIELNNGDYLDGENLSSDIVEAMNKASYRTTGKCESGENVTGYDRDGNRVNTNEAAAVCIKEVNVSEGLDNYLRDIFKDTMAYEDSMNGKYYQVQVFYQLDIPIIKQIYNFSTKGETKIIYES